MKSFDIQAGRTYTTKAGRTHRFVKKVSTRFLGASKDSPIVEFIENGKTDRMPLKKFAAWAKTSVDATA